MNVFDEAPEQERDFWAEADHARQRTTDPFIGRLAVLVVVGVVALVLVWATRAVAAEAPATKASACSGATYTVRSGDSWVGIAKRVKVTTRQLLRANNATAKTVIHPGGAVCLPAKATAPAANAAPSKTVTTAPAPPKSVPVTTQVVQVRTYTPAEAEEIIRAVWPDDLEDKAVAIAKRESNLRPTAKNWCCSGLFQIYYNVHAKWLGTIDVTSAGQLLDPLVNANAAYQLYVRAGGWGPWGG